MPADVALGKTLYEDRQYKALVADYHSACRRCFPDGRLYSNQELQERQEFDRAEQEVITRYADDWAERRSNAIDRGIGEISAIWAAHFAQVAKQQQEQDDAEAAERQQFQNMIQPRPIPDDVRAEHTLVVGSSGSGKTTVLQQRFLDEIAKPDPYPMVIVDPKGLLIDRIQRLDVFNPDSGRLKDRLVILDPTDIAPPALNMFDPGTQWSRMWSPTQRAQVENQTISMFGYIFSTTSMPLTPKQQVGFAFVVRLLFKIEGATVHTLLDILDEKAKSLSQSRFAPFISRLDEMSRRFFENDFYPGGFDETKGQIRQRLYNVLVHDSIRAMLSPPKRKIDLFDCLQNRKIVLVNTGMSVLGSEGSQLLGRYIIAATLNAAFSRITVPRNEWHFAALIVDEFQEFVDDVKIPELLRMAREYNLGVTIAIQDMHTKPMTDTLRSAISTNTSTKYAAGVEATDLPYLARDMRCEQDFLRAQRKTATHVQFACYVRNHTEHPFSIQFLRGNIEMEPQMSDAAHDKLLALNRHLVSARDEPNDNKNPVAEVPDAHGSPTQPPASPTPKPFPPITIVKSAPIPTDLKPPLDAGDPASEW